MEQFVNNLIIFIYLYGNILFIFIAYIIDKQLVIQKIVKKILGMGGIIYVVTVVNCYCSSRYKSK